MKFFSGLDDQNDKIKELGYQRVLEERDVHKVKNLTKVGGELRKYMKDFQNSTWNRQRDQILFYGRLHKILQHLKIKTALSNTGPALIYKRVKNLGSISKIRYKEILGSSVYYDAHSEKWYGGTKPDPWMILKNLLQEGKLDPENVEEYLKTL